MHSDDRYGYLRFPTIHDETIVFVCEDGLWRVGADGGLGARLTAGVAPAGHPHLSEDGAWLAFVGHDEGPEEVYVMRSDGGPARRLTFDASNCTVVGWRDEAILYASNAGRPFARDFRLHRLDPEHGISTPLGVGPARSISYGPHGGAVLGRNIGGDIAQGRHNADQAAWKRYRGGRSGQLWIDTAGSGRFEPLVDLAGNLAAPCWVGERIYFLSDHEDVGNVYSCRTDGTDLQRHTDHQDFYARGLSTDGDRLVYHCGADLYLLDPRHDGPVQIPVRLVSRREGRSRSFVAGGTHLGQATLGPDGSNLALTSRGKAFSLAHWEGPARQHGETDGVRYRQLAWLAGHERLVAAAGDEDPDEHLVVLSAHSGDPDRRLDGSGSELGRVVELAANPQHPTVALANHRGELLHVNVDSDPVQVTRLDRVDVMPGPHDLAWSPDGCWLAYTKPLDHTRSAIAVVAADEGEAQQVTEPVLHDRRPAWDPRGDYLFFLGQRDLDPVSDQARFDHGFPLGWRAYALVLRADGVSPFVPEPRPPGAADADTSGTPDEVRIDFAGIADRVVAFPLDEARYQRIAGLPGKVLVSSEPVAGGSASSPFDTTPPATAVLDAFDLDTQETERLLEGISDFGVDPSATTMVCRVGNRLRVLPAGAKPARDSDEPNRQSGWVDLDRVRVSVRPGAEWRQMFREAWRLQRDHFWADAMAGIRWDDVYARYLPLVDRIASRSEFSDLVWEMHGELGTSHAYDIGGDYPDRPNYQQGHLGVDWGYDGHRGRFRIEAVVRGDPWNAQATSPLMRPGTGVEPGDEVLAIAGQPVGAVGDSVRLPGAPLVNQADQEVEITVARAGGPPRRVTARAVGDERPARYRDWVNANRARAHDRSDGRVGYLHLPNMLELGFAEFHRAFLTEHQRDALIVDARFNGGGNVSALLLEKLARRRLGYQVMPWSVPMPWPPESPAGPLVAMCNEHTGSDGDIFAHAFQLLGLGPLVGTRTWGGVVGVWPRHTLADGSVVTQPEFSLAVDGLGWGLENRGAIPDVEVDVPPGHGDGEERQLDRAIDVALERLEAAPPHRPAPPELPRLAPTPLPPRRGPDRG